MSVNHLSNSFVLSIEPQHKPAGRQNKLLGSVAQADYTGDLDCLRRRLVTVACVAAGRAT